MVRSSKVKRPASAVAPPSSGPSSATSRAAPGPSRRRSIPTSRASASTATASATIAANAYLRKIFGFADDAPEQDLAVFAGARFADAPARQEFLDRLVTDGAVTDYLLRMRRADGTAVWVEVTARAIAEGGTVHVEALIRDVSERKKLDDRSRDLYLQLARVRDGERFVGAEVLAEWYRRNFCIFANIARAVESPADRVLVLFGQGHVTYLRELVKSSPDLELVEPNDYLAK